MSAGLIGDGLGSIELRRPERLNAMNIAMLEELASAADVMNQAGARVVVVSGSGRSFCAGADLDEDWTGGGDSVAQDRILRLGGEMAGAIRTMDAVTVAAVRGRIVGGGVVLAASCDLRVAADDAIFSIPEVDLGIPLGWDGVPALVAQIGPVRAAELILTCREFDADEALAIGFVNETVAAADLETRIGEVAQVLLAKPAAAISITKRQLRDTTERLMQSAGDDVALLREALAGRSFGRPPQ